MRRKLGDALYRAFVNSFDIVEDVLLWKESAQAMRTKWHNTNIYNRVSICAAVGGIISLLLFVTLAKTNLVHSPEFVRSALALGIKLGIWVPISMSAFACCASVIKHVAPRLLQRGTF